MLDGFELMASLGWLRKLPLPQGVSAWHLTVEERQHRQGLGKAVVQNVHESVCVCVGVLFDSARGP